MGLIQEGFPGLDHSPSIIVSAKSSSPKVPRLVLEIIKVFKEIQIVYLSFRFNGSVITGMLIQGGGHKAIIAFAEGLSGGKTPTLVS